MKLRRRHVLIYVIVISLVCLLIVFQSFDKYSRNSTINSQNKQVIEKYLDDEQSKFLLDNNIDVKLFLPFIKAEGFNIENYEYYNLIKEYFPNMKNIEVVTKGNELVNYDYALKYLRSNFRNTDYSIDQLLNLARVTSLNPQTKIEFYPRSLKALANRTHYIDSYKPKEQVKLENKYTVDQQKIMLNKEADEQLNLMCDNLELLNDKKCGGLKIKYGYLSYSYVSKHQEELESFIVAGYSDFQLGNTIMFAGSDKFEANELYLWLLDNSYRFGFVQRYPSNKTDKTNVNDALGVFRYVGSDLAKEMHDDKLSIEEVRGD